MSYRLYLSGSMQGRIPEQVREERKLAVKELGHYGIFGVDPGAKEQKLWSNRKGSKISLAYPRKIIEAFVIQDLWLIRRCDALLVMTGDTPSDGTWWEMSYAKQIGIPVVMIAPRRAAGKLMGWSNILADYVVADLHGAIKVIRKKLVPVVEKHHKFFDRAIKNASGAFSTRGKKRKRLKTKRAKKSIKSRIKITLK